MTIVGINSHPNGSTKTIMVDILDLAEKELNYQTYAFWGCWQYLSGNNTYRKPFGFKFENVISGGLSRLTGIHGIWSIMGTLKLIYDLNGIRPDIIHLHNLHLWTINIPLLVWFIKKNHIKVVWTLHDCWAFTGHCPHFIYENCLKWKDGCGSCPRKEQYPFSYIDNTKLMWRLKKKWFTGVEKMVIVTPSVWLQSFLPQSFLSKYPSTVINNGIDLEVFKPTHNNLKQRLNINGKFLLLGVALGWDEKKGLDVFLKLDEQLPKEQFQIVLIGVGDKLKATLPSSIISINRTNSQRELAEYYTAADLFVNPTREDNYPTVNMESIACGTPVLTFNTGGCAEMITPKTGLVVSCGDYESMKNCIYRISEDNPFSIIDCIEHAKSFDKHQRYRDYLKLYKKMSL